MKQSFILLLVLFLPFTMLARVITIKKTIYWDKAEETVVEGNIVNSLLICSSCNNDPEKANLPEIIQKLDLSAGEYIKSVRFISISTSEVEEYSFSKIERKYRRKSGISIRPRNRKENVERTYTIHAINQ